MGKLHRNLIKHCIHIIERHFLGPHSEYGASVVQTQGARLLKQRAQNTRKKIVSEVIVHFICACSKLTEEPPPPGSCSYRKVSYSSALS